MIVRFSKVVMFCGRNYIFVNKCLIRIILINFEFF